MAGRCASLRLTSRQTGQHGPCFHEPQSSRPTHSCFQFVLPGSPWKLLHPVPGRRRGSTTCSTWLSRGERSSHSAVVSLSPALSQLWLPAQASHTLGRGLTSPWGSRVQRWGAGLHRWGAGGRWGLCLAGQTPPGHTSPGHSASVSLTALPPTPCLIKLHTCPPSNIWSNEKGKKTKHGQWT